jgi:hypothetical protein
MASFDDDAVLAEACRLVERARATVGAYAGALSPARTDQVSDLLGANGCHVEVFPFHSDTVAMVLPQCAGVYPIFINRSAEETDRLFALRHELGHVLAGDVDGPVFLAETGYMAPAERAADLFALADLVPGWWIAEVRRGRTAWREVKKQIALAVAQYAESWPAQRFGDRAELRLRLWREHGI